ncbi:MAG: phosphopantothenoylcysteine decarboxylase/phosphopantothenate/cysteine ligase [Oscillospiraceae bacterium]|nr:phosphopantothenoylcysteine decarboxylase/phosphopantothenate/cysteine ligase [Oscillospiraceae bacterium]
MTLKGKTVVLGVTGGIAAYKMADLASRLSKEGCNTHVIMTKNATEFITPLTFETLTGNKCILDTFDRNFEWDVKHVSLAQKADAFLIAPATANVIAKLAHGLADDMLTTTVLAAKCLKIIAPSMNTAMYENEITQNNIKTLKKYGFQILEPDEGVLACKDVGKGRLPTIDALYDILQHELSFEKSLAGINILITAGPTGEALDPVRYITNHSSGKMGFALAKIAALKGANVTLISGKTNLITPLGVKRIDVFSADEMFEEVKKTFKNNNIIIKSAAVGDYKPKNISQEKIKKQDGNLTLELIKNQDILSYIGQHKKQNQVVCGFSMETQNLLENSTKKLESKNADMIIANNLKNDGAGFNTETNIATIITAEGAKTLPKMLKTELAEIIIDELFCLFQSK